MKNVKIKRPNYGYPLISLLVRIILGITVTLCLIILIIFQVHMAIILAYILLFFPMYIYVGIILFKKNFYNYRINIQNQILQELELTGNEKILDLGAGAGALTILFAKNLKEGKVYAIDKYGNKKEKILKRFVFFLRNNYIGNTFNNAQRNAEIENVADRCEFITSDFTQRLNFSDGFFDVVASFQSLHLIPPERLEPFMKEIDRLLKRGGEYIFFEPVKFLSWDSEKLKCYFSSIGYKVSIKRLNPRAIIKGKKYD